MSWHHSHCTEVAFLQSNVFHAFYDHFAYLLSDKPIYLGLDHTEQYTLGAKSFQGITFIIDI